MTSPPVKYVRQASYTDYTTQHPTDQQPGTLLDADFGAALTSINQTIDRLGQIQRGDGPLVNNIVTPDSLSAATLALLLATGTVRGAWLTLTAYGIKDLVSQGGITYIAVSAHVAGVFAADLAAGKWLLLSLSSDLGTGLVTATAGTTARSLASRFTKFLDLKDFGAVCDGVTNDYAAIMSAHDNAPDGSVIFVTGAARYTSPLVFTRRLSWFCPGVGDYFMPALTNVQDALTITGTSATLPINAKLNIYGLANCCSNGLVLRNVHYSQISANVKAGAVNYAYKLLGCLESDFTKLISSVNFTVPLVGAGLAAKHCFVDFYNGIAHNANTHNVIFEGSGDGITIADQSSQGNNTFRGTIEGITGRPIIATGCYGLKITDLHLEANSQKCQFNTCTNLAIELVLGIGPSDGFDLIGCRSAWLNENIGSISIDVTSTLTKIGHHRRGTGHTITNASVTTEFVFGGAGLDGSPDTLDGGSGSSACGENIFLNPFVDIWGAGAAAAPDGFGGASVTYARDTGTVYPGNPSGVAVAVTSTSVVIADGAEFVPEAPYLFLTGERWISVMVPVYVAAAQPNVIVYVFNGAAYQAIGTVTAKDVWTVVRGSCRIPAANNWKVVLRPNNGAFVAGNYSIGGASCCNGVNSPNMLRDDGKRLQHVVAAVGYTPALVGQRAYVSGTGKAYVAKGVASNADWLILN